MYVYVLELLISASNLIVYQEQRYATNRTEVNNSREGRSSPATSRPGSGSSASSQWPTTSGPSENYLPRRQETWNGEIYSNKRSATPTWTELGSSQLEPTNASSWDRQSCSSYLQRRSSPNTSWSTEYKNKSGTTGWSDVTVGYQQQRRGSLQLWQFLVALLDDPANAPCIAWTGRGMEFKLIEPEEVSQTQSMSVTKKRKKYTIHI